MYNRGAMTTLTDARDEIQSKLEEARGALQAITCALEELEDAENKLDEAISALEEIDGFRVSVDVDAFEVDLSIDL